jgi:hypothetical protein
MKNLLDILAVNNLSVMAVELLWSVEAIDDRSNVGRIIH